MLGSFTPSISTTKNPTMSMEDYKTMGSGKVRTMPSKTNVGTPVGKTHGPPSWAETVCKCKSTIAMPIPSIPDSSLEIIFVWIYKPKKPRPFSPSTNWVKRPIALTGKRPYFCPSTTKISSILAAINYTALWTAVTIGKRFPPT